MTTRPTLTLCAAALAACSLASCTPNQQAGDSATVKRAVRDYVAAIDARDGHRVCSDLVAGALRRFALPKRAGGSCAAAVGASIGYSDADVAKLRADGVV